MGEERKAYKVSWESLKERVNSEDQDVDGRMGSEWILGRMARGVWSGFNWLRIGAGGGLCECGHGPSGSGATELRQFISILILFSRSR
jgi:hypothetical protein